MAGVIQLPQRFLTQPQYDAPVNPAWIKRGLVIACNPAVGAYNQVSRQHVTNGGGLTTTPTGSGKSWNGGASKYIDFGGTFDPSTSGMTAVQVVNPGSSVNVFPFSNRNAGAVAGIEILIGNGGVAGLARFRMHSPEVATGDLSGLNDNKDHVLVARFTPSTEIKIWADVFSKGSANVTSIPASTTSTQNLRLHSRSTTYYTGKSGVFLYFDRPITDDDVEALLQNPNVVYQAPPVRIYVSSGATSYTLTAAAGAFALTGTAASLKYGRVLQAASGSFAVTGTAATLRKGYSLQASSGSFATTGTAATLRYGRVIQAAAGSFQVSGTDASLKYGRVLAAQPGAFALTGTDATLTYGTAGNYTLTAQPGSFSVSGAAATLRYGRKLSADSGAFAFTGTAATLRYARRIIAEAGEFAITGTAATLTISGRTVSSARTYTVPVENREYLVPTESRTYTAPL